MPASTLGALYEIQKDLRSNRNIPSERLMHRYPIYTYHGQYYIAVLGKVSPGFSKSYAVEQGYEPGTLVGNIASMRIPLHMFTHTFNDNLIQYVEIAERMEPFVNVAVQDTRADSVHMGINLPQSYTGKDVIIGVVDWGFDYTHPDFYDTALTQTRILAAWDQVKKSGPAPAGFSHGTVYETPAALLAAEKDTFSITSDMHGTHVAGIAGGGGAGTPFRGVGFESEFLFSQMRSDASSGIDAFNWMYTKAKSLGKPLVINNSWGSYRNNPLDGTSLLSQAIESYIDSGVVFVYSGGNNGDVNFHLKKTFSNDSVKTRITGFNYSSDTLLWGQCITMWGEAGMPFSVQLRIANTSNVIQAVSPLISTASGPAYLDTFLIVASDTVFYRWTIEASHPLNGRPQMTLEVKNTNWYNRCVLYSQAAGGTVHYWNTRLTIFNGGNWGNAFSQLTTGYVAGDKNYGIGHPGITHGVITVAAHQSNLNITTFSSYGPRMDDVSKPDISAPGYQLGSALNSFAAGTYSPVTSVTFNSKVYDFVRLSGTSMSAPMVSGIVALILEAEPNMLPLNVKNLLCYNARTDSYTGTIPANGSVRWGMGKVNAYAAIKNISFASVSETDAKNAWSIYPNPASDKLFIEGIFDGTESYEIFSMEGKCISKEKLFTGYIDISSLKNGMYILTLKNNSYMQKYKVMVN